MAYNENPATPTLASGTYSPGMDLKLNLQAGTPSVFQYLRVGDVVTVSGQVQQDPASSGTAARFNIELPIASNVTSSTHVAGVAYCPSIAQGGAIYADTAAKRAMVEYIPSDSGSEPLSLTFTYLVI